MKFYMPKAFTENNNFQSRVYVRIYRIFGFLQLRKSVKENLNTMKSTGSIRKVALDFVKSATDELFAGNFVGNFEQTPLTLTAFFSLPSLCSQLSKKRKKKPSMLTMSGVKTCNV